MKERDGIIKRLKNPKVSYMEIKKDHFSCGSCMHLKKSNSFCMHPHILAKVSSKRGCCNLYKPPIGNKVSSNEWDIGGAPGFLTFMGIKL